MDIDTLLKSCARTLYLSAKIMPPKTRQTFSVAYLLCRIADTAADTTLVPTEKRLALMGIYPTLIKTQDKNLIKDFKAIPLNDEPKYNTEKLLLENFDVCIAAFNDISKDKQEIVLKVVKEVCSAMEWDLSYFPDAGTHLLKAVSSEENTKKYCVSMGGAPGIFWAKLLLNGKSDDAFIEQAKHIGCALQITNILRDIASDLQIGRIYLPISDLTENNLMPQDLLDKKNYKNLIPAVHKWLNYGLENISSATSFIAKIPRYKMLTRATIMWPTLWCLDTFKLIAENKNLLDPVKKQKISKKIIYLTMLLTPLYVFSNTIFDKLISKKIKEVKNII